jgi:hypothetical protein
MLMFKHFFKTAWGTRAGIGDPTAATSAADTGVTDDKMRQPYDDFPSSAQYAQQPMEMQTGRAR